MSKIFNQFLKRVQCYKQNKINKQLCNQIMPIWLYTLYSYRPTLLEKKGSLAVPQVEPLKVL